MEAYEQLEAAWAEFNHLNPAGMVVCNSGTAALHLALQVLRPTPNLPPSYVLLPTLAMVACARAVHLAGFAPLFVDCNDRLLLDHNLLYTEDHYTCQTQTSTLLAVHNYGRICDMPRIAKFCEEYALYLVEDLAEAHGQVPHPFTDAACWSFYKNKIIAGFEGGAVWYANSDHARVARSLRSLGFTEAHDFTHLPYGHNYRLSNPHATAVLKSLTSYNTNLTLRRHNEAIYNATLPSTWRLPPRAAPWVYDLQLPEGVLEREPWRLDHIIHLLQHQNIAARHCFKPLHQQEEFRGSRLLRADPYKPPLATQLAGRIIYLPLAPAALSIEDAKLAMDIIEEGLNGYYRGGPNGRIG